MTYSRWIAFVLIGLLLVGCGAVESLVIRDNCAMTLWNRPVDALNIDIPERGYTGDEYTLMGMVRDGATCVPIAGATVIFDMANADGEYDGVQQGRVTTNELGMFMIRSNLPGVYNGGPPHIHLFAGADDYTPITIGYNMVGDESAGWAEIVLHGLPESGG